MPLTSPHEDSRSLRKALDRKGARPGYPDPYLNRGITPWIVVQSACCGSRTFNIRRAQSPGLPNRRVEECHLKQRIWANCARRTSWTGCSPLFWCSFMVESVRFWTLFMPLRRTRDELRHSEQVVGGPSY